MKRSVSTAIRVVVSGLLIFLLAAPAARFISPKFPLVNVSGLPEILRTAGKGFLLAALACYLISVLVLVWRWKILIAEDHKLPFFPLVRLTFIGLFFNNFMPTGSGGDIVKGYYLLKGRAQKLDLGISILMDRVVGMISIMTMGFIALIFFPGLPKAAVYSVSIIYIAILLFMLIAAWPGLGRVIGKALFLSAWGRPAEPVRRFYYGLHNYLQKPSFLLAALLVSFAGQVLIIGSNYLVTCSLGRPVNPASIFVFIPLIWTFAAVPSLGGLGVRETGYLVFFQSQLGKETAFALALIMLCIYLVGSLIGGLVYFLGGGQWQKKS